MSDLYDFDQPPATGKQPMITVRLVRGIVDHFPIRKSEWIGVAACFAMGIALRLQPDMFDRGASFASMALRADEFWWGIAGILVATIRFGALGVNGSYKEYFTFSPHLRLFAAVVALLYWSQWCLGMLMAYNYHDGALSGVVMYGTLCLLELLNITQCEYDRKQSQLE